VSRERTLYRVCLDGPSTRKAANGFG
jgi:hypothetical protein